jgi:hypothetical protein
MPEGLIPDLQQLLRDELKDESGHPLVEVLPRDCVRHMVSVARGINGFVEVDCSLNPGFPLMKTVLDLKHIG